MNKIVKVLKAIGGRDRHGLGDGTGIIRMCNPIVTTPTGETHCLVPYAGCGRLP